MHVDILYIDSQSDRRDTRRFFFMRDVKKNLSAPSWIERRLLIGNDSHPSITSEPSFEDEEPNPTATPNLAYKYTCSSTM